MDINQLNKAYAEQYAKDHKLVEQYKNCPPCNQECNQGRTCPAKKPLSDDEIKQIYEKIYKEGHDNQVLALAKAIEERHGIK